MHCVLRIVCYLVIYMICVSCNVYSVLHCIACCVLCVACCVLRMVHMVVCTLWCVLCILYCECVYYALRGAYYGWCILYSVISLCIA